MTVIDKDSLSPQELMINVMTNSIAWTCETWDMEDKPFSIDTSDESTAKYKAAATKALSGLIAVMSGEV